MTYGPTPTYGWARSIKVAGTAMAAVIANIRKIGRHFEREGLRGTRSHNAGDVTEDGYSVGGQIKVQPTSAELAVLVPLLVGTNGALSDRQPEFDVVQDDGVQAVQTFSGCKADGSISGSAGGPIEVDLNVIGKTSAGTGSIGTINGTAPMMFSRAALTLGTVGRYITNFALGFSHGYSERRNNSLTTQDISEGDRVVTLEVGLDYHTDNSDLVSVALAGIAGSLVVSDGTNNHTFTFPCLQKPHEDPDSSGRNAEVPLRLALVARQSGTSAEVTYTGPA